MPILPFFLALAAASAPHLTAIRTDRPPVLDGRLDDPVWQRVAPSSAFTQKLPEDGKPPAERTSVRIAYDDAAVYVAVDCEQRRAEVIGRLTRRDRDIEADSVSVALDTRSDGKSAFEFAVNAAGVRVDVLRFNDTDTSQDWDENWEAKVARTPTGWSAELSIPLRILRFRSLPVQSWGLQVRRYTSMTQELDEWAYAPRDVAGEVSLYGRLDNLVGLQPKTSIELRPFVLGYVRHLDPASDNLARGFVPGGSLGLDLKWHVSQSLTLDATFLPDFGQVEADQVALNLTNFELYYPEKRPFFLEGVDTFSTPLSLLYTRRIGAAPDASLLYLDDERLVHAPGPSTILGAAKLVGELGGGVSIGELVAITGAQTVNVRAPGGAEIARIADPLTTYKILRLKRDIGANGHVGLIAMATNRLEPTADRPLLPGAGALTLCPSGDTVARGARCFHDAYVAGVDARWRSPGGDYALSGQAIGTMIQGGVPRTQLDGTVLQSGDIGPAVNVRAAKEGGRLRVVGEYELHGAKVDYNDLGYMQRQNLHNLHGAVAYRTLESRGATLETRTGIDFYERDSLALLNQMRRVELTNVTRFKSFWEVYTQIHYREPLFDDREVGDGAALERRRRLGFEAGVSSDPSKRVSLNVWSLVDIVDGGLYAEGDGKLSFRILPQLDLDLLPSWIYTTGEPRYFAQQGDDYLFGRLRAQSLGLTLRSTYTFTPDLSLQAYAQLFLDAGHYTAYSSFPAKGRGTVIHLDELRPGASAASNPDFQDGTFNASLVLRWEYRLGSTLYVVYTHAQSDAHTLVRSEEAGFNFKLTKPRVAEDEVLVKLSYWWGG